MNKIKRWALALVMLAACGGEDAPVDINGMQDGEGVTWYGDVAHVARAKCMGCHNDESPTFSMTTYGDHVQNRAGMMAMMTASGQMPPWKPSGDCNSFDGERTLTDDEKAVFEAWADNGAPAGDPAMGPDAPAELAGLDRVDRELIMEEAYLPAPPVGDVNDLHCFVLDPKLSQDELMVGFDIKPGESKVVHHVLLYMADAADAQAKDASEPGIGYTCNGGPGVDTAKVIAGWVPGMPANSYPESTGIPLTQGSTLIMQIHYNTLQAGPLPDQTTVQLKLADEAMPNNATIESLADPNFAIPPQMADFTTTVSVDVPVNATMWALAPHMHLKGRRALVEVERAAGGSECMIDIPSWDFDWQQFYFFQSPVALYPGDKVKFSCTWDNNTPDTVTWGDGTEDEMCITYSYITVGHQQ